MKKIILESVLIFLGLVILSSCGQEEQAPVPPAGTGTTESPAPTVSGQVTEHQITDAEVGQEVTCPVMADSKFKVKKTTPAVNYDGKIYYFCCGGCPDAFKKEPEKYTGQKDNEKEHQDHNH